MQRRATLKRESLERRLMVPTILLMWLIILVKSSSLRSSWLSCGPVNPLQWLRSYRVSVTERWSTTWCIYSCKVSWYMLALWFPGDCRREYSCIVALFCTISMAVSRVPLYSASRCNERVLKMTSTTSLRRLVWLFSSHQASQTLETEVSLHLVLEDLKLYSRGVEFVHFRRAQRYWRLF